MKTGDFSLVRFFSLMPVLMRSKSGPVLKGSNSGEKK